MEIIPIVGISIWLIVKVFFLIGLLVYLVFALVVLKQVNTMTDTLDVGFEVPVKFFSILHFFFAIFVFIFAIITL